MASREFLIRSHQAVAFSWNTVTEMLTEIGFHLEISKKMMKYAFILS